jgi:peptidoglycan/xylan/chitin deacetylase (PgdA/CDA1 family)
MNAETQIAASLTPRIKSAALRAMTTSGVAGLFRPFTRNAGVVFMLHRFSDPERGVHGNDPASVRELLAYLRRWKYHLVDLPSLYASLNGEGPRLRHAVAFTVDDGYLEQATIGAPLFAEFDCPVTTFVTTGFLDGALWFWWDQIEYVLTETNRRSLSLRFEDTNIHYELRDEASRRCAERGLAEWCKTLPDDRKRRAIMELATAAEVELPEVPPPRFAPMTWNHLRACERIGMTFGPHTVTHPILAHTGDLQARSEIVESWARLTSEAERPMPFFAYPNGLPTDFGEREFGILRQAGLQGAVTATPGFATSRRYRAADGAFLIPRFPFPDSLPYLIQQVGGLERLKSFFFGT